jgi:hypothetical protein
MDLVGCLGWREKELTAVYPNGPRGPRIAPSQPLYVILPNCLGVKLRPVYPLPSPQRPCFVPARGALRPPKKRWPGMVCPAFVACLAWVAQSLSRLQLVALPCRVSSIVSALSLAASIGPALAVDAASGELVRANSVSVFNLNHSVSYHGQEVKHLIK